MKNNILFSVVIPTFNAKPYLLSCLSSIFKSKAKNYEVIDKFARKELGEGYKGNYQVFFSEKVTQEYVFSLMKEINRKFLLILKCFGDVLKKMHVLFLN